MEPVYDVGWVPSKKNGDVMSDLQTRAQLCKA
jgi:hypothetical protein